MALSMLAEKHECSEEAQASREEAAHLQVK